MKRVLLLGATGSIGSSACEVIRAHRDDFSVAGVAARAKRDRAEALGREFGAPVFVGEDAAVRAVESCEADLVLVATVGLSGLLPTLAAMDRGVDVALATKEVLVAAGELVTARARARGVRLIPVDSEHSAIFQCLQADLSGRAVDRLTLTASGGPFLEGPADLSAVTPAQALRHPRWEMGPKVTVDSATMMNKGFEVLEASWFFGVPPARVDVVVHPESVVHSLVTFVDGSTLAQLAPDRLSADRAPLDLVRLGALTFRAPDETRFPCLRLAQEAAAAGGTRPTALSAADEVAVDRFLAGDIAFTDIPRLLASVVASAPGLPCDSAAHVLEADRLARERARAWRP